MKKLNCPMCDTHKANLNNQHQWCDACEGEFSQVQEKISHQCKECPTPISCMMQMRCGSTRPVANETYEIKRQA